MNESVHANEEARRQAEQAVRKSKQVERARAAEDPMPHHADLMFNAAMDDLGCCIPADPGHECTVDEDSKKARWDAEGEPTDVEGELGDTLETELGLEDPPEFDGIYEEVPVIDLPDLL